MEEAIITKEMTKMLSNLKGKMLTSYELNLSDRAPYAQQVLRINLGRSAVNIYNEELPLFVCGGLKELAYFRCDETETFPYPAETKLYLINEKIKKVSIIRDQINYNNGEYELEIDQSIIINTDFHKYAFCRESMIGEFIKIQIDKEDNCLISEEELKLFISLDESEKVNVIRKTMEI